MPSLVGGTDADFIDRPTLADKDNYYINFCNQKNIVLNFIINKKSLFSYEYHNVARLSTLHETDNSMRQMLHHFLTPLTEISFS